MQRPAGLGDDLAGVLRAAVGVSLEVTLEGWDQLVSMALALRALCGWWSSCLGMKCLKPH